MSSITQITTQKRKGRYNIFIDGHYAFPVSESTLIRFRLGKGMAIDEKLEQQIKAAEVDASAYSMALDYLNAQLRTEKEVTDKLAKNEFPPEVIAGVLAKLKELNYLSDAKYAELYLAEDLHLGDKGPKVITSKLRQKGIDAFLIQDALGKVADEDWQEVLDRDAKKAARQNARRPFKEQTSRIKLSLLQKGFDSDAAQAAVARLDLEPDVEGEENRLETEAAKQWRLKRKYTGYDKKMRVKQALMRKGYGYDAIEKVLTELEQQED